MAHDVGGVDADRYFRNFRPCSSINRRTNLYDYSGSIPDDRAPRSHIAVTLAVSNRLLLGDQPGKEVVGPDDVVPVCNDLFVFSARSSDGWKEMIAPEKKPVRRLISLD